MRDVLQALILMDNSFHTWYAQTNTIHPALVLPLRWIPEKVSVNPKAKIKNDIPMKKKQLKKMQIKLVKGY